MSVSKTNICSRSSGSISSRLASSRSSVISIASTQKKIFKKDFSKFYVELCHLQHSHPLQMVKQNLDRGVLDILGDRIKFDEWYPIVSAIRSDEVLNSICIRLRHRMKTAIMDADTDLKARNVTTHPVLVTKFVLYWLLESIRNCLSQSPSLTVLELDGIPINGEFLALLAEGILETKGLQHLSLSKCGIQDDGVEVVCMAVRNASSIISLDFSCCQLTHAGALLLAKLISVQKLRRYSEAWTQTLRYRDPDVETMQGLRRITVNHNPEIGDKGVQYLVEEIRDDLWFRALDVQNTGITEVGARFLIQLIKDNTNLAVVDARENPGFPEGCLSQIMTLLAINNADKNETEYKWKNITRSDSRFKNNAEKKDSKSTMKPWGSSVGSSHYKSSTASKVSSRTRSQSPLNKSEVPLLWRTESDSYKKENESLRRQLSVLNDILGREARRKSDLIQENQILKESLEKLSVEKRRVEEELALKPVLSEESIIILDETLSKLAIMCTNREDVNEELAEIPGLLSNMRSVINQCENNGVELRLQDMKLDSFHLNKRRLIEETIVEDVEPPHNSDVMEKSSSIKAQQIFSKMLRKKKMTKKASDVKGNHWTTQETSSSDDGSS